MEQEASEQAVMSSRIEELGRQVVERIFSEEIAVERIEIQFATDGMYLLTVTPRGEQPLEREVVTRG